eukprot:TRINITY_DN22997_c0_g1_i1.p1 TRINITY_DN22997_c0_g1~~TRINITY_DN22997_c0_g1_i1.p1  ORF type:complete len:1035 (-),score=210.26 TRINITY_DN22997_c0_g1_i1:133-3177(-)
MSMRDDGEALEGCTVSEPSWPVAIQLLQPEKEGLRIELQDEAVSQISARAKEGLETIQAEINESGLVWKWRTFPVELPPSAIALHGRAVHLGDLFQKSAKQKSPEELQRLSRSQKASVRKHGTFESASGVDGLPNVWMLTRLLVVGTHVLRQKRCQIYATAFALQRYSWCRLFFGGLISIYGGLRKIAEGVGVIIDLFVGWRWMEREHSDEDIEQKLESMLFQKTLAELDAGVYSAPESEDENPKLPSIWKLKDERGVVQSIDLSFAFEGTRHEVHGDLRKKLQEADKELRRKRRAEDRQAEPWLPMQREQVHLAGLPSGLDPLLVATSTLSAAQKELQQDEEELRKAVKADIEARFPVRKLCSEWCARKTEQRVEAWRRAQSADLPFELKAEVNTLDRLKTHELGSDLTWWVHILDQKIKFLTSPECSKTRTEMKAKLLPAKVMQFNFIIWRPKNWIITKHGSGENCWYEAQTQRTYKVSTKIPGWRLWVLCVMVLEAANNGCFFLIVSLIYGPLGLKAICSPSAFYPATTLNRKTGVLETDTDMKVESLLSRLAALWSGIFESRSRFEAKPDVGLLGKSITRLCNLTWNYLFLGFVGTTILLVFQPVLTLLNIPLCIVLFVTPMLWAPVCSLLLYVCCILLVDVFASPAGFTCLGLLRGLVWVFFGMIEAVISLVFLVILPFANVSIVILRLLHNFMWAIYDAVIFHLIIRRCARVPADDSFTARRISGPGISASFYFHVSPAIALAALQQQLELTELKLYERHFRRLASQPQEDFAQALRQYILAPFGLDSASFGKSSTHLVQQQLQKDYAKHTSEISKVCGAALRLVRSFCDIPNSRLIRLSRADLARTMESGARIVKAFAETRWFPLLDESERLVFWDSKDLTENDWMGLARHLFAEAFSTEFTDMPTEEMDEHGFFLEVTHTGLEELIVSLVEADPSCKDPLTTVTPRCPRAEASNGVFPDVTLESILVAQPSVPLRALTNAYREELRRLMARQSPGGGDDGVMSHPS